MSRNESEKLDRAMSRQEVAERLDLCVASVHNLMKRGELVGRKVGNRTVIFASDFQKFVERCPVVAAR